MEALVFLFVTFIFVWLLQPPAKGPAPDPSKKIKEGLEAAAEVIGVGKFADSGGGKSDDGKSSTLVKDTFAIALLFGFFMALILQ